MAVLDVAVGILVRGDSILITRRRSDSSFAGSWEFPGGKREPGETIEQCLVRELWEELALRVIPETPLPAVEHAYPTTTVRLAPFFCRDADPTLPAVKLIGVADARWINPADLPHYAFPPANAPLIQAVHAEWAKRPSRP